MIQWDDITDHCLPQANHIKFHRISSIEFSLLNNSCVAKDTQIISMAPNSWTPQSTMSEER